MPQFSISRLFHCLLGFEGVVPGIKWAGLVRKDQDQSLLRNFVSCDLGWVFVWLPGKNFMVKNSWEIIECDLWVLGGLWPEGKKKKKKERKTEEEFK